MSAPTPVGGTERERARFRRPRRRIPIESVAAIATLLAVWAIASSFVEDYIAPPLPRVLGDIVEILTSTDLLRHVGATLGRVILGLVLAFVIGTALGLAMGYRKRIDRFAMPLLQMAQGVPSLAWVIIAVIWFQSVELRITYILVVVTLPGFAFQALDSYRAIPKELRDMARSLRPRRFDLFRTVTWPAIVPDLLTAWKVNIGLGTRVVLIAELVGSSLGVGYQLLVAQQYFNMAGVIAWTGTLVLFVLLMQYGLERAERRLLRYRPNAVVDTDGARTGGKRREAAKA